MFSIVFLLMILVAVVATSTVMMKRKQASNGANVFFSVSSATEKLTLLVQRFPVSVFIVGGLSVLFFIAINDDLDKISYKLWLFFSTGIFISIVATLFAEDFFDYLKSCATSLFVILLWGAYCYFLPCETDNIQISKWIEISAISWTAFFAMFFISFLKTGQDRAFWNFTSHTLFQMALACIFGSILFGGLSLALLAIDSLFNVSIDAKLYGNLAVVCYVIFAPLYFLANIPKKTEKRNDEIFYTKVQKILAIYILTPILAVYAAILYAYLFKIVFAWELPNGWVTWLVSALALGGLLVITVLYPVREASKNKIVYFISRWFGLLILPLLILMTIGIFRRIGDYGITINRCYVLLLNLWFYGIYIYLFFTQSRHIKWILISPVAIALITSISAWGMANITKNSLTKEVSAVLNRQLSNEEAKAIFAEMSQDEKDNIRSKLEYLHKTFGKESVQPFFTDRISDSSWSFLSELELRETINDKREWIYYEADREKTWEIGIYSKFKQIDYNNSTRRSDAQRHLKQEDTIEITADNRTFILPIRDIVSEYITTDEILRNEREWTFKGDDFTIFISSFSAEYYPPKDSIFISRLSGFLFYR